MYTFVKVSNKASIYILHIFKTSESNSIYWNWTFIWANCQDIEFYTQVSFWDFKVQTILFPSTYQYKHLIEFTGNANYFTKKLSQKRGFDSPEKAVLLAVHNQYIAWIYVLPLQFENASHTRGKLEMDVQVLQLNSDSFGLWKYRNDKLWCDINGSHPEV